MATIYYTGNQKVTRSVYIRTVTAVTVSVSTITATINSKTETYTATATDTIATFCAAFVAQLQSSLINEFKMVTWASDGVSTVSATGTLDGRQVTVTWGGTATSSTTTTVAATSPYDVTDVLNYSGGALPVNGDVLVFENNAASMFFNLSGLTAITYTIIRRQSHTGTIGLSYVNQNYGFVEFLPRYLECAGTSIVIADNSTGFVLIKSTAATAVTFVVTGNGGGALGGEFVEVFGLPASSVIDINGGTLSHAPLGSQTSLATTVLVANGVYRSGPSVTVVTCKFDNSQIQLNGPFTTATINNNTTMSALQATAGTTTNIQGGNVRWGSTGTPGASNIYSDGTLDLSTAPANITSGTITINEGGTLNDPLSRITRPYTLATVGDTNRMTINYGISPSLTVN